MSQTLARGYAAAARSSRAGGAARAYWNPYAVGFLLGLVLLATYMVAGRGLGATAAFAAVAAWLTGLVSPEQVQANAVHVRYWNEGAPLQSWTLFVLIGMEWRWPHSPAPTPARIAACAPTRAPPA